MKLLFVLFILSNSIQRGESTCQSLLLKKFQKYFSYSYDSEWLEFACHHTPVEEYEEHPWSESTGRTCFGLTKAYIGLGVMNKVNITETIEQMCSIFDISLEDIREECCKPDCPNIVPMLKQLNITEAFKAANETKRFLNVYLP